MPPSSRNSARDSGLRTLRRPAGRAGSFTANRISPSAMKAGMTATQKTDWKSLAKAHISTMARSGPRKAPTVSSDWRRPKAAPRRPSGARSATSASRGAPRMPLPTRSMKRAVTTQPIEGASGKIGFVSAARPYPIAVSSLRRPIRSDSAPENTLVIAAVASAMPSITPTARAVAPRPTVR